MVNALPILRLQKLSFLISLLHFYVLNIGSWLHFCLASHIVITLPTIAPTIVVALLRSGKAITLERAIKKWSKELILKPRKMRSDNFTRSNREKSNFAIAIISYFGGTNNNFADCIWHKWYFLFISQIVVSFLTQWNYKLSCSLKLS